MDLNALSRNALKTAQAERSGQVSAVPPAKAPASASPKQGPGLQRSTAPGPLRQPAPAEMQQKIDQAQPARMQAIAQQLPVPPALAAALGTLTGTVGVAHPLAERSDAELVQLLMRGEGAEGPRYHTILRNAEEIEASGILSDLQELNRRQLAVPDSELDRSVADDAVLVMRDFSQLSATEIAAKKEAAYAHPEVQRDQPKAIETGYYGSDQHKAYGALVEQLSAGLISAEEAMAMNPSGGIPGPGMKKMPLIGDNETVIRHAMRHDATGFLMTRFGVGPGYGSPTTPFGLDKDNPLAGQILGIAREALGEASTLPPAQHVALPGRFNERPRPA